MLAVEERSEQTYGVVLIAWLILISFLLASAAVFFYLVLVPSIVTGCFDGNEPACFVAPTPGWVKGVCWGLWSLTGGLAVASVVVAYRERAARIDRRWAVTMMVGTLTAGLAFTLALFLLP